MIDVFALSSVRNSNKFSFDTITKLQSFVSIFIKKSGKKQKFSFNNIIIALHDGTK